MFFRIQMCRKRFRLIFRMPKLPSAMNTIAASRKATTWFRVTAWGKLGELCNQYLVKGRSVLVEGEVDTSAYTGQDGQRVKQQGEVVFGEQGPLVDEG